MIIVHVIVYMRILAMTIGNVQMVSALKRPNGVIEFRIVVITATRTQIKQVVVMKVKTMSNILQKYVFLYV